MPISAPVKLQTEYLLPRAYSSRPCSLQFWFDVLLGRVCRRQVFDVFYHNFEGIKDTLSGLFIYHSLVGVTGVTSCRDRVFQFMILSSVLQDLLVSSLGSTRRISK